MDRFLVATTREYVVHMGTDGANFDCVDCHAANHDPKTGEVNHGSAGMSLHSAGAEKRKPRFGGVSLFAPDPGRRRGNRSASRMSAAPFHWKGRTAKMSAMFQTRLIHIMQRELQAQNLQLSAYASQRIEQLVKNGIHRMRVNNASEHAGLVLQAEQNLKFLVRYFSDYAREAGSFPSLKDQDFDAALKTCPTYWPYSSGS